MTNSFSRKLMNVESFPGILLRGVEWETLNFFCDDAIALPDDFRKMFVYLDTMNFQSIFVM